MDGPFFTDRRRYQQPDPYHRPFYPSTSVRGVPVHHVDPTPETHRPAERASSAPKVVRIPVHFVGSEKVDRSGLAVKIQKVFRGFLVRKSLRKIKDINVQVHEIDERLKRSEVVDLVRRDAKERLRMNETLMALLLKLDSICGVDFGVRGCRKAVIKKAISLQERIDAIVATDSDGKENGEIIDLESDAGAPPVNSKDSCDNGGNLEDLSRVEGGVRAMEVENCGDEDGIIDVGVDCEVKVSEANGDADNLDSVKDGLENVKEEKGANDGKTNRELLERMMEENEKMMSMMTQLFERNELQTTMLDTLTRRVELLEKAFLCDRLRKKKKAKAAATPKESL